MNRYRILLLATIASLFTLSCADVPQQASERRQEGQYVTGSRMPVRAGTTSAEVSGVTDPKDIRDSMRRTTSTGDLKGGGH
jgi:hypothetical protein